MSKIKHPIFLICLQALALFILFYGLGRFSVKFSPDSPSYIKFDFSSIKSSFSQTRTFMYPLILKGCSLISSNYAFLPYFQFFLHIICVIIFYLGLRSFGFSKWEGFIVASPLLYARAFLEFFPYVLTDGPATSLVILSIGLLLISISSKNILAWLFLAISVFFTYQIRPMYLFLIPLIPLLGFGLGVLKERSFKIIKTMIALLLISILPYFAFCFLRLAIVSHFGLVSFSGANIIGLATQMLTPDLLPKLPEEYQPLASEIIKKRELDYENMINRACAKPLLGPHSLSFETWGACYNYHVGLAYPIAFSLYSDNVTVDRKLQGLSISIIKERPIPYLVWLFKAFMNSLGGIIKWDYLFFIFGILLLIKWLFLRFKDYWEEKPFLKEKNKDFQFLSLSFIGIGFFLSGIVLVILVEPPIPRYTCALSIFLPSILIFALFNEIP